MFLFFEKGLACKINRKFRQEKRLSEKVNSARKLKFHTED